MIPILSFRGRVASIFLRGEPGLWACGGPVNTRGVRGQRSFSPPHLPERSYQIRAPWELGTGYRRALWELETPLFEGLACPTGTKKCIPSSVGALGKNSAVLLGACIGLRRASR